VAIVEERPGEIRLLLISRRQHEVYNSVGHRVPALARRRPFNPAYLNPADAAKLGVSSGDRIEISSAAGSVQAIVQSAPDVRSGVLSMAHCFTHAALSASLIDDASDFDALSGLPRMSAIPVHVRPVRAAAC
jgi:anaerobic selenocysteine-containing dehydrogenase